MDQTCDERLPGQTVLKGDWVLLSLRCCCMLLYPHLTKIGPLGGPKLSQIGPLGVSEALN